LVAQPEKANPFGQPARLGAAMPAPLSVLVSRPSSTPSSPVQEDSRYVYPSLSGDSKVGRPAMKLMDSGAIRPPPSSTTASLPSTAARHPFRHRMDGSSVVRPALPVTPPVPPQVAPMEGVLPEAVANRYLSSVCNIVQEKRPPSENLLQRSRRVEKIEVSHVSSKAQLKFAGAWEIQSMKRGGRIGEAVVASNASYIKLNSTQGREDPLRIEGTGEAGKPFLVVDAKNGTYYLFEHHPARGGCVERLIWKHSKEEKYTKWVRMDKTQRAMNAFRARKAKSVGEDQNDLAQAFNDVIAGPPSKRRKLVSNCSNESTATCKAVNLEANKENIILNRPVPQPQAPFLGKGLPGDRAVLKTYGKRPRALPNSPEEDEFVCY